MTFFDDYNDMRCDVKEFEFIKSYLDKQGWSWYMHSSLLTHTPKNLALIGIKSLEDKTLIPYFIDELHYIIWDKDVKEVIRELKINDIGI